MNPSDSSASLSHKERLMLAAQLTAAACAMLPPATSEEDALLRSQQVFEKQYRYLQQCKAMSPQGGMLTGANWS